MPEGSNYRNMWSGYPKENMEYPDYSFKKHFGKATPSFPSRRAIYDYISGRVKADDIEKYIKFSSVVRWLAFDQTKSEFTVHVENLDTCDTSTSQFDYVIIATGDQIMSEYIFNHFCHAQFSRKLVYTILIFDKILYPSIAQVISQTSTCRISQVSITLFNAFESFACILHYLVKS